MISSKSVELHVRCVILKMHTFDYGDLQIFRVSLTIVHSEKKCQQPNNRTNTHDRTNAKIAFHCIHVSKLLDRQSIFSVLLLCTCNEFMC